MKTPGPASPVSRVTQLEINWPIFYLLDRGCNIILSRVNRHVTSTFKVEDYTDMMILFTASQDRYNQRQVANLLDIPINGMTRRLNMLEERGYIQRTNPENRRENSLHLTPKGKTAVESWQKHIGNSHHQLTDPLNQAEVDELHMLLSKIVAMEMEVQKPNG